MIAWFWSCLLLSLKNPRAGMRQILALPRPQGSEMVALLLMAISSALLLNLSFWLMPLPEGSPFAHLFDSPIATAGVQFATLLITALLTWLVGGWFRGTAKLPDAILAVAWLQAIMLVLQLLQLLLVGILPALGGLLGLAAIALFVVLLSNFIAEIHGFASPVKVCIGAILTFLVAVMLLSILLAPFIPAEMLQNGL